jgi:hypothetical protein
LLLEEESKQPIVVYVKVTVKASVIKVKAAVNASVLEVEVDSGWSGDVKAAVEIKAATT